MRPERESKYTKLLNYVGFFAVSPSQIHMRDKRTILRAALATLILAFSSPGAHAITWGKKTVPDPLADRKECAVQEPGSYGSYIYEFESKYDQVFWPMTDSGGIWFCEHSGYTAFIGDFNDETPTQKAAIAEWLKQNYRGDRSIQGQLRLLEGIYSLRGGTEESRNHLLRVLARWQQSLGNVEAANVYRRQAFDGIKVALNGKLEEERTLEYLYLAANYARQFGDAAASDRYLAQLSAAITGIKNKKLTEFGRYLAALAKQTPSIQPGGVLDPQGMPTKGDH